MPAGWFHQTHDLIVYGRIYARIHRAKDAAARTIPGRRHRQIGHPYYLRYNTLWTDDDRYPRSVLEQMQVLLDSRGPIAAERMQVAQAHDCLDRVWDDLARPEREYWEGFFVWLLYRPDVLENWAKVDVIRGRIHRVRDGQEMWEDSPETVEEYRRLRREVSRHQKSRLAEFIAQYGEDALTTQ